MNINGLILKYEIDLEMLKRSMERYERNNRTDDHIYQRTLGAYYLRKGDLEFLREMVRSDKDIENK